MSDLELREAACRAVGLKPETKPSEHSYPGILDGVFGSTSDCTCGAWMGSSRSGAPDGIDPFGECPDRPPREEWPPVEEDPAASHRLCMAAHEAGLGWPVAVPASDGRFIGFLVAGTGYGILNREDMEAVACDEIAAEDNVALPVVGSRSRPVLTIGSDPFMAIARAVKAAGEARGRG